MKKKEKRRENEEEIEKGRGRGRDIYESDPFLFIFHAASCYRQFPVIYSL